VKELQVDGLVLPWRPLYEIVDKIFFDPTPALVDFNGPNPSTYATFSSPSFAAKSHL